MKSKISYANLGGTEAHELTKRDVQLLSRRNFIRRASLFLPLGFFAGSALKAGAASTIISRTISAANQNAISMANSTWARPVALPASWNKIRVGCRLHMTNTAANLTSNPIFAMGFSSGTSSQYGDATTQHFIGMVHDAATFTYAGAPAPNYQVAQPKARVRINTTNTDSAALNGSATAALNANAAAPGADRQILFLDITKGSPNYTFHTPFNSAVTSGLQGDVSAANFLFYMGQASPVPSEANYIDTHADQTLAVNEGTNGTLNAINFYWNRTDATLEICDVAVAVLS